MYKQHQMQQSILLYDEIHLYDIIHVPSHSTFTISLHNSLLRNDVKNRKQGSSAEGVIRHVDEYVHITVLRLKKGEYLV